MNYFYTVNKILVLLRKKTIESFIFTFIAACNLRLINQRVVNVSV